MIGIIILTIITFLMAGQGWAQAAPQITTDLEGKPFIIRGWLDDTKELSGSLRLTAREGDIKKVVFLRSDLKRDGGDEVIQRHQVTPGEINLAGDVPQDVQIKVTGISTPGQYRGQITLLIPGQAPSKAMTIPLVVIARGRPDLKPLPDSKLNLNLVNCAWGPDCVLAKLLLPASAFVNGRDLKFDNATKDEVNVLSAEPVVFGEKTGYQLDAKGLAFPKTPVTLPANQVVSLQLGLDRSLLPPDHYTGSVYLTLDGQDKRQQIEMDLNVRKGPLLPAIFLLVGILLGRLVKYMQGPGKAKVEGLTAINRVEVKVQHEADPDDQAILGLMFEEARQTVYRGEADKVQPVLDKIKERLEKLKGLRAAERSLRDKEQDPDAAKALAKIAEARRCISDGNDDQAKALLEDVQRTLAQLQESALMGPGGQPDKGITRAKEQVEATLGLITQPAFSLPPGQVSTWGKRGRSLLVKLSGLSDEWFAEATLWIARPLLYFALLFALLWLGMESLYVDKGVSFGAQPLLDYFTVIFWGLSSDVASRTLGNLKGT
ncbi:MAG: hypothetical protein A4E63_01622 [Syntrophorhabdus sp. PtaU1.Bin050]|nr:MAG: hypothetical protein A4E63_01622 [Syntrophorhabdus sp. PtaU1.Bin050]